MRKRSPIKFLLAVLGTAATMLSITYPSHALQLYYTQDQIRNPATNKWAPNRFGYMPSNQRYLPGTHKVVAKKCIANGQARCMAPRQTFNPYASRLDAYNNMQKSRSGSTASPIVKTFNYDESTE